VNGRRDSAGGLLGAAGLTGPTSRGLSANANVARSPCRLSLCRALGVAVLALKRRDGRRRCSELIRRLQGLILLVSWSRRQFSGRGDEEADGEERDRDQPEPGFRTPRGAKAPRPDKDAVTSAPQGVSAFVARRLDIPVGTA
jgi:hypothetical protein